MANKFISLFRNSKRYSGAAVLVFLLFILVAPQSTHAGWLGDVAINFTVASTAGTLAILSHAILYALSIILIPIQGLLSLAIDQSISNASSATIVSTGWGITRDVANLFFIFIMLAISIATILRRETYGAKALLPRLIIVALLINFSLPITKTIIDISNVLAIKFYDAAGGTNISGEISKQFDISKIANLPPPTTEYTKTTTTAYTTFNDTVKQCKAGYGFGSTSFNICKDAAMTTLNTAIKTAGDTANTTASALTPETTKLLNMAVNQLWGIIYIIIIAFIFLALSALFLIRYVVLQILLILSPMAFMFAVLPKTQQYAGQWWDSLFKQSFFAPVALFFLYLSIKSGTNTSLNITDSVTDSYLMNYLLQTILLLGAIVVSQKLGAVGASTAIAWGGAAYKGVKGFAGRQTIGRGAAAADKAWGEKLRAASPTFGGLLSGGLKGLGAGYAKSVDARIQGVTSIKNPELQAKALANLSEVERKTAWGKLNKQQKAELQTKAGTTYANMIGGLAAGDEKKREEQAGARMGAALAAETKKQQAAEKYRTPAEHQSLLDQVGTLNASMAAGTFDTKDVEKMAKDLSVFGKSLTEVEKTLHNFGNPDAAKVIANISGAQRAFLNAALGAQQEYKEKGGKPDATGTPTK